MKRARNKPTRRHGQLPKQTAPKKSPFIEHIHELRKRLFYIALSIIGVAGVAFYFQKQILAILRHPAGDQIFVTTTPGGAFNFLFTICITTGVIVSIPVIVYQVLRYMQPVIKDGFMRTLYWGSIASGLLAIAGVAFGYIYGLPNSLRFLFGQSANLNVEAMITIDSYASFVTMYLLGAALLFQVPLILLLINRIKPLTPGQLLRFERPFIVGSAIMGAIISPSPNVGDMLILTVPMIVMYQLSMIIIWVVNRKHRRPRKVVQLLKKDAELQAQRLAKFHEAEESWQRALQHARASHKQAAATMTRSVMAAAVATGPSQVMAIAPRSVAPAPPKHKPAAVPAAMPKVVALAPKNVAVAAAPPARPTVISPTPITRRPSMRRQFVSDVARRPQQASKRV
jgi:sec-independent protein translocase protein TatC